MISRATALSSLLPLSFHWNRLIFTQTTESSTTFPFAFIVTPFHESLSTSHAYLFRPFFSNKTFQNSKPSSFSLLSPLHNTSTLNFTKSSPIDSSSSHRCTSHTCCPFCLVSWPYTSFPSFLPMLQTRDMPSCFLFASSQHFCLACSFGQCLSLQPITHISKRLQTSHASSYFTTYRRKLIDPLFTTSI